MSTMHVDFNIDTLIPRVIFDAEVLFLNVLMSTAHQLFINYNPCWQYNIVFPAVSSVHYNFLSFTGRLLVVYSIMYFT